MNKLRGSDLEHSRTVADALQKLRSAVDDARNARHCGVAFSSLLRANRERGRFANASYSTSDPDRYQDDWWDANDELEEVRWEFWRRCVRKPRVR